MPPPPALVEKQRPTSKCLSCWNVLAQLRGLGRSFSSLFLSTFGLVSLQTVCSLRASRQVSYRTACLTRHAYHTAFCRHPPEPPSPPQACLPTPRTWALRTMTALWRQQVCKRGVTYLWEDRSPGEDVGCDLSFFSLEPRRKQDGSSPKEET